MIVKPYYKKLIVSVDVDSPLKLLTFHKKDNVRFDNSQLERFYEYTFDRCLDFFKSYNIKATFFVVGDELENSKVIQKVIQKAFELGHEIENHTYSHPFGLASLSDYQINAEIEKCRDIIENTVGLKPIGIRSPGYNVNSKVINIAENLGLLYDSSGFWSIMNPVISTFHKLLFKGGLDSVNFGEVNSTLKQFPYFPSRDNWLNQDKGDRKFAELPFPMTNLFKLPFYNNFNLWLPKFYSAYLSKKIDKPYITYLFHIIEFSDLSDDIPNVLKCHPNVAKSFEVKKEIFGAILSNLMNRYQPIVTRDLIKELRKI